MTYIVTIQGDESFNNKDKIAFNKSLYEIIRDYKAR